MLSFVVNHRALLTLIVQAMGLVLLLIVAHALWKRQRGEDSPVNPFVLTFGITTIVAGIFLFFVTLAYSKS